MRKTLFYTGLTFLLASGIYAQDERVIQERRIYKKVMGRELAADVFYCQPALSEKDNPAIVFFHGGGWAYGSPAEFHNACRRYAEKGFVTFSMAYRLSIRDDGRVPHPLITPVESVMDARSALRWVKEHAEEWHIDPDKVIAAGQSAGGQLALSTALLDHINEATDNPETDPTPCALLLYASNVNTMEAWVDRLLGERRQEIWSISPYHHLKPGMPPAIEFHGTADPMVNFWIVEYFREKTLALGNRFEQIPFEGRGHYLAEGDSTYATYFDESVMERTDSFLLDLGLMPQHPGACQPESLNGGMPAGYRIYNIGNSHTWDHRPATGFREIARAMDMEISNGWHINCGQNINTIRNNPEQVCVELTPFGNFEHAISNYQWDAITIQPFVNGLGNEEAESIRKLYEFIRSTENKETDVFVYCTWPRNTGEVLSDFDYSEAWLAEYNAQDTLRNLSEGFFAFLEESAEEFAADISFVRVGRVMYHFDQRARSGQIPGFSGAGELYRDPWHLNNVGRYMAGLSMFSAILGIDPNQVPDFHAYPPSEDWPGDREMTADLKKAIREVVAEVR